MTGERGGVVFGITDSGTSFSFHPGVFLGGLPPTPWSVSDLLPPIAAIIGGVGLFALIARGRITPRSN
jgi:hypothetical protein